MKAVLVSLCCAKYKNCDNKHSHLCKQIRKVIFQKKINNKKTQLSMANVLDFCFIISDDFDVWNACVLTLLQVKEEEAAGDIRRLYFYPKDCETKAHILGAVISLSQISDVSLIVFIAYFINWLLLFASVWIIFSPSKLPNNQKRYSCKITLLVFIV